MKSAVFAVAAGCVVALAPVTATGQEAAGPRTQQIYVSVLDSRGMAVTGLTVKDFTVREDSVAREVLSVEPAKEPLDIVVLVDDSQVATSAIPNIRDALLRFVKRMQPHAKVGLVTVGERPMSVVNPTSELAALEKGVGRIFARPGTGAYLLEGIDEVLRGFRRREAKRPTIIAITLEGPEFSNLRHERVVRDLVASGVGFHVIALGTPAPTSTDELRERGMVLAQGTERTGGRRDQLLSSMALPDRMLMVAGELINQYLVTYARPEKLVQPEKVEVTVTRPELTVRARTRLPQPKK